MTAKGLADEVKAFARAFWHAMGDRDNHLKAIREFLIGAAVIAYILGAVALAQAVGG